MPLLRLLVLALGLRCRRRELLTLLTLLLVLALRLVLPLLLLRCRGRELGPILRLLLRSGSHALLRGLLGRRGLSGTVLRARSLLRLGALLLLLGRRRLLRLVGRRLDHLRAPLTLGGHSLTSALGLMVGNLLQDAVGEMTIPGGGVKATKNLSGRNPANPDHLGKGLVLPRHHLGGLDLHNGAGSGEGLLGPVQVLDLLLGHLGKLSIQSGRTERADIGQEVVRRPLGHIGYGIVHLVTTTVVVVGDPNDLSLDCREVFTGTGLADLDRTDLDPVVAGLHVL